LGEFLIAGEVMKGPSVMLLAGLEIHDKLLVMNDMAVLFLEIAEQLVTIIGLLKLAPFLPLA